jgi:hypothetical protein
MQGMTPYEKAARTKRAREREEDARFTYNSIEYLEAWIVSALPAYHINGRKVSRALFLQMGFGILMEEIWKRQRREREQRRALQRAQRDPAGGEDRHSS